MHSMTKYLNGHSDVTARRARRAGCAAGAGREGAQDAGHDPRSAGRLRDRRGLKTLAVRVERHNASGLAGTRWLEKDTRVKMVYYPRLEAPPHHRPAREQRARLRGFGGGG